MSKCVMLIRHAEKPGGLDFAVNESGRLEPGSLSVQGWRRAGALIPYFAGLAERLHRHIVQRPQYIVAARPTRRHPSTRPRDTVEGLADRLGIPIDERWCDQDPVERLARHLRTLDGPVLLCWRHDYLPAIAHAMVGGDDVPSIWPGDRFDLTWSCCCEDGQWRFHQVPQLLLAGDRLTPIDWPQRGFSLSDWGTQELERRAAAGLRR